MSADLFTAGFAPEIFWALLATSFAGSFITVALGIGGGALVLAVMASLMPPAALIPVHGAVQLGSNIFRAGLLLRHVHWPVIAAFAAGSVIGVAAGGVVAVNLAPGVILIAVGVFVIWSVLLRPPEWLSRLAWLTGTISSFLTMFFGATGVFVANFTKSLNLPRRAHVATHAAMMTLQHGLKIGAFAALGFAFAPWFGFIAAMIGAGFLGTVAGRLVLERMSDRNFKLALDILLVLIAIRLIWRGVQSL